MMGQPKPFASLSSGLLARKGQARPAMRPQGFSGFGPMTTAIDDLGWNDMGLGEQPAPAPVLPIASNVDTDMDDAPVPPVLVDRAALKEEFADEMPAEDEPAPVMAQLSAPKRRKTVMTSAPAPRQDRAVKHVIVAKNKAAFTLRLDENRHLRLRLASALTHQSAQQLVTAALDAMLQQMPEVEAMAAGVVGQNDHQVEIGS